MLLVPPCRRSTDKSVCATEELLNCEADGLDEDGIAGLDGDVVVAGFYAGDFDYDLVGFLRDDCGFVVVLVVGEENRGDFIFAEIFAGDGDGVVGFAGGGIDATDMRIILGHGGRDRESESHNREHRESKNVMARVATRRAAEGWDVRHGAPPI
jgi:hypothetical protein